MRFLLVTICTCALFACAGETQSPPELDIDFSGLNDEAASLIQSKSAVATSAEDWKVLGMLFQSNGLEEPSILAYEYSLTLNSDPKTHYLLAISQAGLGNYGQAIQSMSKVTSYLPAQWNQGYWQLDLGNNEQAKKHFETALALDSTSPAATIGLARVYLAKGNPQQSITLLQGMVDEGRKHPYITYLLGKANQHAGNIEIAEQLLKNANSVQPKWLDPWQDEMHSYQQGFSAKLIRAIQKIDARDLQGGLEDLKSIEKSYPFDPVVQNNLATVQMQLGQTNEAIRTLGKAMKESPNYAPLQLTMAFALAQAGEENQAVKFAEKALALQPTMFAAASLLGRLAYQRQDYQSAYTNYALAIELGDTNLRTREMLAEVLLRFNQFDKAIFQYEIVLSIDPKRTPSIGGVAVALAKSGKVQQAMKLLLEAQSLYPNDGNLSRAARAIQQITQTP